MSEKPLLFLDPFPRNQEMVFSESTEQVLRDLGRLVIHFGSRAPDELVEEILPEVEVIIGQTAMPKERLDRAPKLRAILNVKANWEPNIDYMEAHVRGIRPNTFQWLPRVSQCDGLGPEALRVRIRARLHSAAVAAGWC